MPKLLQLNVTANWGSTGKIAEGIGLAAIAHGWESIIAYGRMCNPSQSKLLPVGTKVDTYLHFAQHRLFDREGLGSKGATRRLIAWIKAESPDIIHLHNIHDHWLNYPLLFEYLAMVNTPVVWTFHDCWAFTGGCAHFENSGCYRWRTGNCDHDCKLKRKNSKMQFANRKKLIGALGDRLTIVCVSNWLADYARQSFLGKSGSKIKVIHNGINLSSSFSIDNTPKLKMILGVSNVWPTYKGLGDFIELRTLLPTDCRIVVVGLSKKQIDSLPAGIEGLQRTASAEDLAKLYRQASVFVNPTYNDSFPTVNLEALACGTPVVTYRTGGSPEAVDEKTGIIVEKGNVEDLAKSINHIIDSGLYISDNCRKRAEKLFNQDIQFNKYIDLYTELLNI